MRASAEAHRKAELRELTRLAAEQAALRRVATMVAHGSSPEQIFVKVAEEVGQLLGVQAAAIHRYEHDEDTIVGSWGTVREAVVVRCAIIVNGRPWGALDIATAEPDAMPASAESRLNAFTELVATASRTPSGACRPRRLTRACRRRRRRGAPARRARPPRRRPTTARPRRHDTQARLAERSNKIAGPTPSRLLDEALRHAETRHRRPARARARHPALGARARRPAGRACARSQPGCRLSRSRIDVTGRAPVRRSSRPAAYFTIAEALTNVLKHAGAPARRPHRLASEEGVLPPSSVRDDGVGGADPTGSGIIGLSRPRRRPAAAR